MMPLGAADPPGSGPARIGSGEKKRRKAAAEATKKLMLWVYAANAAYVAVRLAPCFLSSSASASSSSPPSSPDAGGDGWCGFGDGGARLWPVLLRLAACFYVQRAAAAVYGAARGDAAVAGKNADPNAGEHWFDLLGLLIFCEVGA